MKQEEKQKLFDKRLLRKPAFLLPLFTVIIGLTLAVWAGRFIFQKYGELKDNVNTLKSENKVLEDRVSSLKSIDRASFNKNVNQSTYVLPPFDPTLQMISQLRQKADARNLSFEKLSLGGEGDYEGVPGVKRAGASFSITGEYVDILGYLSDISFASPLIKILDVKIRESLANVSVETYWSSYPDTLPLITEPIVNLSSEDKSVLAELSKFGVPQFVEPESGGVVNSPRTNPFSLQ